MDSQDGSIEENIPAVELLPMHNLDELEFFPGDVIKFSSGGGATFDRRLSISYISYFSRSDYIVERFLCLLDISGYLCFEFK